MDLNKLVDINDKYILDMEIMRLQAENTELIEWHERDHARIVELIARIDKLEGYAGL